jgi:hypothetical protein
MPHLLSLSPFHAMPGSTFQLTATGTNLQGATAIVFSKKPGLTYTGLAVNAAGTQVTATVTVAADAEPGARSVSIVTPNGMTMDPEMLIVVP